MRVPNIMEGTCQSVQPVVSVIDLVRKSTPEPSHARRNRALSDHCNPLSSASAALQALESNLHHVARSATPRKIEGKWRTQAARNRATPLFKDRVTDSAGRRCGCDGVVQGLRTHVRMCAGEVGQGMASKVRQNLIR